MEKPLTLIENGVHTSDKAIIERLKFQLQQSQILNSRLEKTIENQKAIIDSQKETIRTQDLTVNFLNDWKFIDHRFQTDLKATCNN